MLVKKNGSQVRRIAQASVLIVVSLYTAVALLKWLSEGQTRIRPFEVSLPQLKAPELPQVQLPHLNLPYLRLPRPHYRYRPQYTYTNQPAEPAHKHHQPAQLQGPTHYEAARKLWAKLWPLLRDNDAYVTELPASNDIDFADYEPGSYALTAEQLKVNTLEITVLREKHKSFVDSMKTIFPHYDPPSNVAARGIVMTASVEYLPVAAISIGMLRHYAKTNLPVEVWLNTWNDYEEDFCEKFLPMYNGKCHVMTDIQGNAKGKTPPKLKKFVKFEYKVFAILFSSFHEVLFLDADNIALHPVEELFDEDPYRRTGMVMWPDRWKTNISPSFNLINGKPPHYSGLRASSESGQMMFNKHTHLQALLLAAYYNYYGEAYYYSLLSQNGPGRGDKDTFVPAADTLGLPYWQVRERVEFVGHDLGDPFGMPELAMAQFNPAQDFYRHRDEANGNVYNKTVDYKDFSASHDPEEPLRMSFLHCNARKWNMKTVLDFEGLTDLVWDVDGNYTRAYTSPEELQGKLSEVEWELWHMGKRVCDIGVQFQDWGDEHGTICWRIVHFIERYLEVRDGTPETPPHVPAEWREYVRKERESWEKSQTSEQETQAEDGEEEEEGEEAGGQQGEMDEEREVDVDAGERETGDDEDEIDLKEALEEDNSFYEGFDD